MDRFLFITVEYPLKKPIILCTFLLFLACLIVAGRAKQLPRKLIGICKANALSASVTSGEAVSAGGANDLPALLLRIGEEMQVAFLAFGQIVIAVFAQHPIVHDIAIGFLKRDRLSAKVAGDVMIKARGAKPDAARVIGMGKDDLAAILALVESLIAVGTNRMPLGDLHGLDLVDCAAELTDSMAGFTFTAKERKGVFVNEIHLASAAVAFLKPVIAADAENCAVASVDLIGQEHLAASLASRSIDATARTKNASPLGLRDDAVTAGAADRKPRIAALAKDAILGGTGGARQSQPTATRADEMPMQTILCPLDARRFRMKGRRARSSVARRKEAHGRRTRLGGFFRRDLNLRIPLRLGTCRKMAAFEAGGVGTESAAQTKLTKLTVHHT